MTLTRLLELAERLPLTLLSIFVTILALAFTVLNALPAVLHELPQYCGPAVTPDPTRTTTTSPRRLGGDLTAGVAGPLRSPWAGQARDGYSMPTNPLRPTSPNARGLRGKGTPRRNSRNSLATSLPLGRGPLGRRNRCYVAGKVLGGAVLLNSE